VIKHDQAHIGAQQAICVGPLCKNDGSPIVESVLHAMQAFFAVRSKHHQCVMAALMVYTSAELPTGASATTSMTATAIHGRRIATAALSRKLLLFCYSFRGNSRPGATRAINGRLRHPAGPP
jgi:hypothetical protein